MADSPTETCYDFTFRLELSMHHNKKVTLIGNLFWYGVWTIPSINKLHARVQLPHMIRVAEYAFRLEINEYLRFYHFKKHHNFYVCLKYVSIEIRY